MNYTEKVIARAADRLKTIDGKTVVGFSGGADSTVLLTVLIKLLGADKLTAVHINHMLRGDDADSDENFCREFAQAHGVEFVCRRVDVRAMCGDSAVEETARNARYEVLSSEAESAGAKYIALAHTASDNTETVIFNLCRGSGTAGMRGIPFSRPCGKAMIIRPLIDCTREDIEGFVRENRLSFVTDKTNFDTHYTRNFIRANIVPELKKIFPQAEKAIGNMNFSATLDYDYITREAEKLLKKVKEGKMPISELADCHPALALRAISMLSPVTLDFEHQQNILAMIKSPRGGKLSVPEGKYAESDGSSFFFSDGEKEIRPEYEMVLSEGLNFSQYGFCIAVGNDNGSMPEGYELVGEGYAPPEVKLTARSRRASDKYRFWKMTRKLKKMTGGFDPDAKKYRPVICADEKVIWLPGFPSEDIAGEGKIKIKYYKVNK